MTPQEKSLFKKVSREKGQDGCVFTHPIHLLTTAQSKLKKNPQLRLFFRQIHFADDPLCWKRVKNVSC